MCHLELMHVFWDNIIFLQIFLDYPVHPAPLIRSRLWRFINLFTYLLTYIAIP